MKQNIHPDYHLINVETPAGVTYQTRSTWGKEGDRMKLDIDPSSHPAWTGVHRILDSGGQLSKFKSRFGNFGLKQE